eukprot:Transcript_11301.p2 GENE.Transcript_11301~~Transcript_11301.p2  ORF type:complete len:464 (+),score=104.91 Transcript_11301:759-2150(+)
MLWPPGAASTSVVLSWISSGGSSQLLEPHAVVSCDAAGAGVIWPDVDCNGCCLVAPIAGATDTWEARVSRWGASNHNAVNSERLTDALVAEYTPSLAVSNFSARLMRFSMPLSERTAFGYVVDQHNAIVAYGEPRGGAARFEREWSWPPRTVRSLMACAAVASTIQCGPRLSLVPLLVAAAEARSARQDCAACVVCEARGDALLSARPAGWVTGDDPAGWVTGDGGADRPQCQASGASGSAYTLYAREAGGAGWGGGEVIAYTDGETALHLHHPPALLELSLLCGGALYASRCNATAALAAWAASPGDGRGSGSGPAEPALPTPGPRPLPPPNCSSSVTSTSVSCAFYEQWESAPRFVSRAGQMVAFLVMVLALGTTMALLQDECRLYSEPPPPPPPPELLLHQQQPSSWESAPRTARWRSGVYAFFARRSRAPTGLQQSDAAALEHAAAIELSTVGPVVVPH